jgi:hypothetical protein
MQGIEVHLRDQHNVVSGEESGYAAGGLLHCKVSSYRTVTADNHQGQCQQSRSIGGLADLTSDKAFAVSIMTTTIIIRFLSAEIPRPAIS